MLPSLRDALDTERRTPGAQHNGRALVPPGRAQPDVHLDVQSLHVDKIDLKVEQLRARVSLDAHVLDLLGLSVGADVELGRVELDIEGVDARARLDVRLEN